MPSLLNLAAVGASACPTFLVRGCLRSERLPKETSRLNSFVTHYDVSSGPSGIQKKITYLAEGWCVRTSATTAAARAAPAWKAEIQIACRSRRRGTDMHPRLGFPFAPCSRPGRRRTIWREACGAYPPEILIAIGGLAVMGFFDLGQIAWIISAVLLGIGAIIDFSRKSRTS
jgi:hypothetical protein